jgi:hypothetical protein
MKFPLFLASLAICGAAEVKTLTLRQALEQVLLQNPDVLLARLDQQKARDQILLAKDPFYPKIYGGVPVMRPRSTEIRHRSSKLARTWRYSTVRKVTRSGKRKKVCAAPRSM